MTAVNIFCCREQIIIWTDGANYDADGRLLHVVDKVRPLPHLNAVVIARGPGIFAPVIAHLVSSRFASFDQAVEGLPALIPQALDELAPILRLCQHGADFHVFLAGWSESRGGSEAYRLEANEPDIMHNDGQVSVWPSDDGILAKIRAEFSSADQLVSSDGGLRLLEIQRAGRFEQIPGQDKICIVGGHAQLTIVMREGGINAQIMRRWPDRIGEKLGEAT